MANVQARMSMTNAKGESLRGMLRECLRRNSLFFILYSLFFILYLLLGAQRHYLLSLASQALSFRCRYATQALHYHCPRLFRVITRFFGVEVVLFDGEGGLSVFLVQFVTNDFIVFRKIF